MPVDAGYAGLINRAQQLARFNSADFPPLERRAAPEPPPAPLPIAAMPLAAAAAEGDQFVALDNPKCVPIAPGTVVALGELRGAVVGICRRDHAKPQAVWPFCCALVGR